MTVLVFLLEEPSAKIMLEGVLPRVLPPEVDVHYIVFEGKQDLHKRMVMRMQYWQKPNSRFIVLRDQDSADCHQVRQELAQLCTQAGKPDALVRIACHELESFYLGDLSAVERGLGMKGLARLQNRHKYRVPDSLANASEELRKLTQLVYQKVAGSRAISPYLYVDGSNRSHSFNVLIDGIRRLITI